MSTKPKRVRRGRQGSDEAEPASEGPLSALAEAAVLIKKPKKNGAGDSDKPDAAPGSPRRGRKKRSDDGDGADNDDKMDHTSSDGQAAIAAESSAVFGSDESKLAKDDGGPAPMDKTGIIMNDDLSMEPVQAIQTSLLKPEIPVITKGHLRLGARERELPTSFDTGITLTQVYADVFREGKRLDLHRTVTAVFRDKSGKESVQQVLSLGPNEPVMTVEVSFADRLYDSSCRAKLYTYTVQWKDGDNTLLTMSLLGSERDINNNYYASAYDRRKHRVVLLGNLGTNFLKKKPSKTVGAPAAPGAQNPEASVASQESKVTDGTKKAGNKSPVSDAATAASSTGTPQVVLATLAGGSFEPNANAPFSLAPLSSMGSASVADTAAATDASKPSSTNAAPVAPKRRRRGDGADQGSQSMAETASDMAVSEASAVPSATDLGVHNQDDDGSSNEDDSGDGMSTSPRSGKKIRTMDGSFQTGRRGRPQLKYRTFQIVIQRPSSYELRLYAGGRPLVLYDNPDGTSIVHLGPSPGWPSTLDLMSSASYKPLGFESMPLYLKPQVPAPPNGASLPMIGSASPLHSSANGPAGNAANVAGLQQLPGSLMDRDSIPLVFLAKNQNQHAPGQPGQGATGSGQAQTGGFSIPAFLSGTLG